MQKVNFDKKACGASLHTGDIVLVRNTGVYMMDKLADRWDEDTYVSTSKPRTLHRNHLQPVGHEVEKSSGPVGSLGDTNSNPEPDLCSTTGNSDSCSITSDLEKRGVGTSNHIYGCE